MNAARLGNVYGLRIQGSRKMTSDTFQYEKKKQYSVLTMNTAAFTVNFMVWTMFSIIGIKIKGELDLNETEFGLRWG